MPSPKKILIIAGPNGAGKYGYDRRPSRWRDDVLRALRTYRLRLSRVVYTVKV